ncbi:related to seed imbibition protein Sip1 [Phialocephala subalpina]|uniref:Related to seed imbibition protein Sip1 n=1 Tax=Phialocephala subalpina TaxID=576137 RepID=A0A1L7WSS8_9HELO|nr:related to seed imbibition protein Sip1 [Phialocephala subalpina]
MTEEKKTFISAADGNEVFQAQYIPKQKGPPSSDDPSMKAYISTYPALGQVTQIEKSTSVFTALLEVDESRASDPWQISLWHSDGGDWREVPMDPLRGEQGRPTELQAFNSTFIRLYFTTPLAIHLPTNFTLKFRNGPDQSWKWVKDHQGTQDGVVLLKTVTGQEAISNDLRDYVQGLNPELKSKNYRSQSPGTTLWTVYASVEAAQGEKSTFKDIRLGVPWGVGKLSRWFALVRIWSPWLAPRQGKDHFGLDKEAIMCSFMSTTGKHLVLLAISGTDDVMTMFTSDNDGNVVIHIRNDSDKDKASTILVALGDDFESANAAVMYHARGLVKAAETANGEQQKKIEALNQGDEETKLWAENWYDGLTYCTWNALGQRLTEEKVLKAVTTLAENKINVTNFIIDDNWQSIDYRGHGQFQHGWVEFEAEREAFPKGLKHMVNLIREKHPSIQHIAVWHALLGYWGGLSPDGKIAKTYKTVEVIREDAERRNLPLGGKMTVVAKEDVGRFYDDFYRFLSSCGVDAVKTDAQFMTDTFVSAKARRDLIPTYLDAWTVSTLRHFSIKAISCMSQTPQILFHSQNRFLSSCGVDAVKTERRPIHDRHLRLCESSTRPNSHLPRCVDRFHTPAFQHQSHLLHVPNTTDSLPLPNINQMTGPTPRGKTVIFRPDVVGKSLDQYNGYDDDHLLLVGTYHGSAVTGTGIVGIFNVSQRPLTELIPLSKFPGVVEAQYYVVRAHSSGLVSKPMQVVDRNALIPISLGVRGYDILSAYPLRGFVDKKPETTWIANLGLLGKMAGAAAVTSNKLTKLENGRILIDTNVKALGTLGLYVSTLPSMSFKDDMMITIQGKVIPLSTVQISKVDPHVLEIDVTAAWKELDLDAGWSNEVEVKIFINSS